MKKTLTILFVLAFVACTKQTSALRTMQGNTTVSSVKIINTVTAWQAAQTYYRKLTIATNIDTTVAKYLTINKNFGEIDRVGNLKPVDTLIRTDQAACLCDIYYTFILIKKDNTADTLGIYKTSY